LLLVPAVTVSALELAVLQNDALRASLVRARDRDRSQLRSRGSFAQFADDDSAAT
jgi:hypothetical protein